jgi:hypothetical protein
MSDENFYEKMLKNASSIEKIAFALIILSYFVGTMGLGSLAWVGVAMAGIGAVVGLLKKNWILLAIGAIDLGILIDYAITIDEINSMF